MKSLFQRTAAAVRVALLLALLSTGSLLSYARTAASEVARSVRDGVPIEFELKRLETLTDEMLPEIRENREAAARLDVEIAFLQRRSGPLPADVCDVTPVE